MNSNKKHIILGVVLFIAIFSFMVIIAYSVIFNVYMNIKNETEGVNYFGFKNVSENTFNILSSSENKDVESVIKEYARTKGYNLNISYDGTLDIIDKLNSDGNDIYDAVWLSNSTWMYMLDNKVKTSDSKCTSINPVIFGVKKSKAKELGFIDKQIYTKDIVNAISEGKLRFCMANPTRTDSGASAYLGMLYTLAGNPEVLTKRNLESTELKEKLVTLYKGMERTSGSEEFLKELFLNGEYEAIVTYESTIINMNKELVNSGKEPLYAIYPIDGVSISDSPFAFLEGNNKNKKEIFEDIQSYILSNDGQIKLQEKGRRTWFGGVNTNVDKTVFNPEWGIDTTQYITPVKYPSKEVIKLSLNLYQSELRRPTHVVFCLDYSGSMIGDGYNELKNSMDYILTQKAAQDYIQFSSKDKISIIPFGTDIKGLWQTENGNETSDILNRINSLYPSGSTALYPAAINALKILKYEDEQKYNLSVVLMTDGQGNVGNYENLRDYYKSINKNIPIYSITFGSASYSQLEKIATLTNAKVFDGKSDLVKAFKEVRGYN